MLKNCRYFRSGPWHINMDKKICAIFQHGVDFTWIFLHNMSFCWNVWLQIGGNCARSPTNNTSFVSNGNVFAINIACFKRCSITQNMLLVIMDISFIMMTFAIFSFSMILLGSRKMDKYPCIGMQNVMIIVVIVEHKQNVDVP